MPARTGILYIRAELLRNRTDDERLEIEGLLGDAEAIATLEQRRQEAIELGDFEIG